MGEGAKSIYQRFKKVIRYAIEHDVMLVNAFSTFANASGLQISYKLFHHFFGDEFRFNATFIHGVLLFQEVFETAKRNLHHANIFLGIAIDIGLKVVQEINSPVFL